MKYLAPMRKAMQQLSDEEYRQAPLEHNGDDSSPEKSFLASYLKDTVPNNIEDEWKYYLNAQQTWIEPGKLFSWWNGQTSTPIVRQIAFDLLSTSAMNTEVERVFNDTKLTISPQRTRLGADIIRGRGMRASMAEEGALNGLSERRRGL
jgi:hypothetical protein